MDKKTQKIVCTYYTNGKCHDFCLYENSKVKLHIEIEENGLD